MMFQPGFWTTNHQTLKKSGLISLLVLLLTGCKVTATTGDDYSDEPSYTPGIFLYATDTGHYFPSDTWGLNFESAACIDETLYFETADERIRVYGSPAYSETAFLAAATELSDRIDGVLAEFRMRWPDFVEERSARAPSPEQLIACLSPRISSSELSSASLAAIAIAPNANVWPYDAGRIFTHDLTHYVQENLSRSVADQTLLPLWFAEGQARVFAGEAIAPIYQHYDYDPLWDASEATAGTASYRQKHYALAYRYLENANGSLAMTLLLDLIQYLDWEGNFTGYTGNGDSLAFLEAFDAMNLVDHTGRYLSFARFRADYHQLLESSY